jgi:hypothetical protein
MPRSCESGEVDELERVFRPMFLEVGDDGLQFVDFIQPPFPFPAPSEWARLQAERLAWVSGIATFHPTW